MNETYEHHIHDNRSRCAKGNHVTARKEVALAWPRCQKADADVTRWCARGEKKSVEQSSVADSQTDEKVKGVRVPSSFFFLKEFY